MTPVSHSRQYGWAGHIRDFLQRGREEWLHSLSTHHRLNLNEVPAESQLVAWKECHGELTRQLNLLAGELPHALEWGIVFEYELPRERGRRPDVVILGGAGLVAIEFKGHYQDKRAHLDQVEAYTRDLQAYHAGSHELSTQPMLVLMGSTAAPRDVGDVIVMGKGTLGGTLANWGRGQGQISASNLADWLEADYAPLPTLVSAARSLFNHEPLPAIRRAHSAGIPETLQTLENIAQTAKAQGENHLALITGVPGAGKTLVGLQFVYDTHFSRDEREKTAVFLSGNGPLVKVLQHALKSSVFVQDVHGFLRQYGGEKTRLPSERIWIYDEAQRAWDAARVQEKRGHGLSEPEDFVRLGQRMGGWSMIVGLVGEGQEIHLGEEGGIGQWNEAIRGSTVPWHVHCPERLEGLFGGAREVFAERRLDLNTSLRSHVAESVQDWVRALLDGRLDMAADFARRAEEAGFKLYVSRDNALVTSYVRERYNQETDKRYGWLASSKAKNLEAHGINNSFQFTKRFREGPWFNDPPDSPDSCCQLDEVATEFQCQGLELDMPLVAWGDDLTWTGARWASKPSPRSKARDPHQLRVNSYRVLLSRGRDGVVVYVPPDGSLDGAHEALSAAGTEAL